MSRVLANEAQNVEAGVCSTQCITFGLKFKIACRILYLKFRLNAVFKSSSGVS